MNAMRNADTELKRQENVIASQRLVVERGRDELVSRMRSRKVLESYRERDHAHYLEAESRKEQREFDELAVLRHGRDSKRKTA
jgi:flagellar export protein FliJ